MLDVAWRLGATLAALAVLYLLSGGARERLGEEL